MQRHRTGIGQPFAYNSAHNDLFVDCAGWDDTAGAVPPGGPGYTTGSIEYLQQLFSGLGHAMNSSIPVVAPSRVRRQIQCPPIDVTDDLRRA